MNEGQTEFSFSLASSDHDGLALLLMGFNCTRRHFPSEIFKHLSRIILKELERRLEDEAESGLYTLPIVIGRVHDLELVRVIGGLLQCKKLVPASAPMTDFLNGLTEFFRLEVKHRQPHLEDACFDSFETFCNALNDWRE